jgi:hypothetical protein
MGGDRDGDGGGATARGDRGGDGGDAITGEIPSSSGRFWALSPETDGDDIEVVPSAEGEFSLRYLCRTPVEDPWRDLSARKEKREEKRKMLHWAACTLAPFPPSSDGKVGCFRAVGGFRALDHGFKIPVLQSTTFDLGHVLDASAWTIVRRRRKAKAYRSSCSSTVSRRGSAADRG